MSGHPIYYSWPLSGLYLQPSHHSIAQALLLRYILKWQPRGRTATPGQLGPLGTEFRGQWGKQSQEEHRCLPRIARVNRLIPVHSILVESPIPELHTCGGGAGSCVSVSLVPEFLVGSGEGLLFLKEINQRKFVVRSFP